MNGTTDRKRASAERKKGVGAASAVRNAALQQREHRMFAAREWEWMASVVERISFLVLFSILCTIVSTVLIKGTIHDTSTAPAPT